jgi:hypothetical protein
MMERVAGQKIESSRLSVAAAAADAQHSDTSIDMSARIQTP